MEFLRTKRDEILRICRDHGASNVRIFGSVARGDAGPSSDVDLLVVLNEGRGIPDLIGIQLDLERLLERRIDVYAPPRFQTLPLFPDEKVVPL